MLCELIFTYLNASSLAIFIQHILWNKIKIYFVITQGGGVYHTSITPLFWCGYSNITIHIILAGGYQTAPWNCRRPVPGLMTVGQPALMASSFKCWSSELTHRPLMWGHWPRLLVKCKHVSLNYPNITLIWIFIHHVNFWYICLKQIARNKCLN